MKKIGELNGNGVHLVIKYDEKGQNPYRIYRRYWGTDRYGYPSQKLELLEKYADLYSVTRWVSDYVGRHHTEVG